MSREKIRQVLRRGVTLATWAGLSLWYACSPTTQTTDGGGTRGGNPVVAGIIAGLDGVAKQGVRVSVIAEDFNPLIDMPVKPSSIDTTDSHGEFTIAVPDPGWYNVEAVEIRGCARLLRFHVWAQRDTDNVLPVDTLHKPGTIRIALPIRNDIADGYVYVPGTSIVAGFSGSTDSVELDSVPVGTIPVLYYGKRDNALWNAARYAIPVRADETTLVQNLEWSYCRRIVLNTFSSGAGVTSTVCNFPILIRLNAGNFNFTQARSDGADVMFTKRNNALLPCEIERWNPVAGFAEVWVKIDTIFGNDSAQSITMFWGNLTLSTGSTPESNDSAVFDTADGFQGVWHLSDTAGGSVRDATINRYDGVSPDTARPSITDGAIGNCRRFDGIADFITMPNTANSKLDFQQDGNYTVCAWISLDTFDNVPHCIVAKGYEQYFLRFTCFPSNMPMWEFAEFNEATNWQSSRSPAASRQWILLAGVRQGSSQFLYCNGTLVDSTMDFWPQGISRNTSNDLSIGAFLKMVTVPANDGYCFFKGCIDEVRILNTAQSPDWMRLCYMNQRIDDRFILFR